MGTVIAWLWNLVTPPNLSTGAIVLALWTRFFGKQTAYLVALAGHPVHLLHGDWVCPACYGTGEGGPRAEAPTDWPCWECLGANQLDGTPRGYVRWHYLRNRWSWRGWHPRAVYVHAPAQAGRARRR